MAALMPGAVWRPISVNFSRTRRPRTFGLILHVTAAPNAVSQFGWFNNPSARASSHFHVDIYGRIEQYVDADLIAWCQRSGNTEYLSIETQGAGTGEWTPAQAAAILQIIAWASARYGFPVLDMVDSRPGRRGIGMHRYGCSPWRVAGGAEWGPAGKICPGHERAAQFKRGIFFGGIGPSPTPPPTGAMGWRFLSEGMNGDDVGGLQLELNRYGYNLDPDRNFGPATKTSLVDWQTRHGLEPDGVAGPATQNAMAVLRNPDKPPEPEPEPEQEEEEMKGFYYTNSAGTNVFVMFNEVSGFWSEHSGVDAAYNNTLAAPWETGTWPKITEGHAKAFKKNLDLVRTGAPRGANDQK